MMRTPPADRMLKPDHGEKPLAPLSASSPVRPPLVVVRKPATLREVLGRDPKARVMTGGTRLIALPDK